MSPSPTAPEAGGDDTRRVGSILDLPRLGTAPAALLFLASLYTLYLAREFFLPVILAVLLSFLLRPPVRFLADHGIPGALGAGLVLVAVLGGLAYGTYRVSGPAAEWLAEAPAALQNAEREFRQLRRPVEQVREATQKVEELTSIDDGDGPEPVEVSRPRWSDLVLDQTLAFGAGAFTVVFLLYFLLASGDLFLRKLVRVLPRLQDRKRAVEIARQIQHDVSRYLFTITLINCVLGVCVGLALHLLGMPNPGLWGALAAVFNFVPYVGAMAAGASIFLAALATFETMGWALTVVATFFALTSLEGYLITPLVLGRRLTLNPVVIFLGVIFWGWLWGIPGAVLAVPILATVKIFCDNIEPLSPLAEFLGP